ncbi:PulJ/GspJ family protein [Saliterribacillus persicus]|uniref:Pilin/secretion family protein with methylation motif n=1 Tax=Saliterribacillus persicus TaxID=930114 RepID=A0A368XEK2_9BACI|nr:prepilin-type N-terminal cleavage/methylation domain-containing protein [Saliterribacillus persicus]RCW66392.1 pilin/secretion family protein with methylation motif [Saliterribacillus persicus]
MRKFSRNEDGFTLIELLATLTILMLLIGVTFGVVTSTFNFNTKSTAFTDVRQEANLIVTQIRENHNGENYQFCESQLLNINSTVQQLVLNGQNIAGGGCENIDTSLDLKLDLKLQNNENQSFNLETTIEAKKEKALPLALTIEKPSSEETFGEYVRNNNIYVYSNIIKITGSSTIKGSEATVIIKENFQPASASKKYIEAKEIYIKGDMMMRNFSLGNSSGPSSNIYVDGGITFGGGGPRIYGYLKHTGELKYQSNLDSSVMTKPPEKLDEISFPTFDIPNLKDESWYSARGYSNDQTLDHDMKYFGPTLTFRDQGSNQFHNVSIVSQGNINLEGNVHVSGVLFAPNGVVNINGSSTFKGIIIARQVSVTGNSHINFEMPSSGEEFPF